MTSKTKAIIVIGVVGYILLKYTVEPWVIETVCNNLINCGVNNG